MRLLDTDPFTGVTTYFDKDPMTGKITLKYSQDVDAVFDMNKHDAEQLDKKKGFWKIGTIPNAIILEWSEQCGHPPYSKEWQEYAKKQLNLSENRKMNPNKIRLKV